MGPSLITPDERPGATLDMFSRSQDFAIGRVVGGNMYNTTYSYTNNVHTTPPRIDYPASETIPNPHPPETASSSWEVPNILYRILRPFWIYPRSSEGKCDFSVVRTRECLRGKLTPLTLTTIVTLTVALGRRC